MSAGEYLNVEILNLEEEAKALDKVAQKLEKELRNAMKEGIGLNFGSPVKPHLINISTISNQEN